MILALPFLAFVGLVIPLLGWVSFHHSKTAVDCPLPNLGTIAAQIVVMQTLVAVLALLAAYGADIPIDWLPTHLDSGTITVALIILALVLAFAVLEARKPLGPNDRLRTELRRISVKHPLWLLATVYAGIVEEIAYRGVLTSLLADYLGYWPAAAASAALFGLGHLSGGWRGAIPALFFALAMRWIVHLSGGLFLAMAVHTAYDLGAAWLGHRMARSRLET